MNTSTDCARDSWIGELWVGEFFLEYRVYSFNQQVNGHNKLEFEERMDGKLHIYNQVPR